MHAVPDCRLDIRRMPARGRQVEINGVTVYDVEGDLIARENLDV